MPKNSALLAVCFTAGLIGGLGNGLFIWACGDYGLTAFINVSISPTLSLPWLYPRLIFGGLWGVGYFFTIGAPRFRRHWVRKGLWFSLLPSAVMLFYILPYQQHQGMAGFDLGMLTPLFVVISYLVWGTLTGFFTRLFWGR